MDSEDKVGMSPSLLARCKERFLADPKNRLAQSICTKQNPLDVLRLQSTVQTSHHVFSHKVESEGKPMSNQRSSGRCWIFACLNCMRLPFMKKHNVEEFEFSQSYVFLWDKVERCHYLLKAYVEVAKREGEPADGRLLQHLLHNPAEDGGQWHMLVNVIEKHGLMPKKCFIESWSSDETRRLKTIINTKMREFCSVLWGMVKKGVSDEDINSQVDTMMEEIYRIISICVGSPPDTFTWEYYDRNKEAKSIGPISPKDFYREYVKPYYNLEDKVVFVNDPRPENPYKKSYSVEFLGNMVGGKPVVYLNQSVDVLKKLAADSIKDNEAVWYGCDVGKHCSWKKYGIEDLTLYDYDLVFSTSVLNMNKAEQLLFNESLMTHAMVLTAVNIEGDKPTKWRIENSWGDDGGDKGYLMMTDDWFSEFVFEVVVDKRFVSEEMLEVLKEEPKMLPAWDPMGALACHCGQTENTNSHL